MTLESSEKQTIFEQDKSYTCNDNSDKIYVKYSEIEKKYDDLYEKIPCLVRSFTLDGKIIACNQLYANVLGYSKNEIIGTSIFIHTADQSLTQLSEEIENWKKTEEISNMELWMKKKDNSIFPVFLNGTNLYDEYGKLIGRTGALIDLGNIFESKQIIKQDFDVIQKQYAELSEANVNLKYAEEKYRNLYENSPDLLRTINLEGIILDCNKSYAEQLGYSKNEIIGKSVFDFVSKDSYVSFVESFETWKKTGKSLNKSVSFKRKDGSILHGLISANNLYDSNGLLIGSNSVIKDVSELHETGQKLEESQSRLREQLEEVKKSYKLLVTNERKYRDLYDKSPSLLRSVDVTGIIINCNLAYSNSLGYSKEEVIGKSLLEHTAERSMEYIKKDFETWKYSHKISHTEIWMKRKDETIFPVMLSGTTVYDTNGNMTGRTVALTDLTEIYQSKDLLEANEKKLSKQNEQLKTAYSHLSEVEQRYRTLYEQSPDLIRTIDMNEIITDCNNNYCIKTGFSRDEIMGHSLFDQLAEKSLDVMRQALDEWNITGIINNKEIWMKRKDGSIFPTLLLSTNLYDKDGNLSGRIGALRDMTEIYAAKKEIEEHKTGRLTAIGELSARVAHDLRNPVSILSNTFELLKIKNPDFKEKNKDTFERIERSIKRISHQIEEVLDYVQPKSLNLSDTSLIEILKSAISNTLTREAEIHLPKSDVFIRCDSEKLEIVFTNLILNAIQAMNNSGHIYLRIKEEPNSQYIVVEVEDTGPGIPDNVFPKLFDPLFTTRQIGTGLGLVSCKSIVEKHGGAISVKTQVGKGTIFSIKLPL